ncbi:MAG: stage 0 sporulation protein [Anaerolineae bacterium]|nr:MAG: stage 0 sporulation protein [Anaerolineae bacterium]
MQPLIIGVRFSQAGKIYHFDSSAVPDVREDEYVIVDTARGEHLGRVVRVYREPPERENGDLRKVERRATPRDLTLYQTWRARQQEALERCRARLAEMGIEGVKIIAAEFNYNGSRLAFLYSCEGEERVDLKDLRRAMQRMYPRSKVELRQIGPRDIAKIIGGMGACGMEKRCCSLFLTEFTPISIKMAKEQGISLTPSEITGMCGRLRCCLIYEFEQYVEARKHLPKRNKRVITPHGPGKVVEVRPLRGTVVVQLDSEEKTLYEFHREDLEPWDELEALRRKAAAPCAQCEEREVTHPPEETPPSTAAEEQPPPSKKTSKKPRRRGRRKSSRSRKRR